MKFAKHSMAYGPDFRNHKLISIHSFDSNGSLFDVIRDELCFLGNTIFLFRNSKETLLCTEFHDL